MRPVCERLSSFHVWNRFPFVGDNIYFQKALVTDQMPPFSTLFIRNKEKSFFPVNQDIECESKLKVYVDEPETLSPQSAVPSYISSAELSDHVGKDR